MTNARNSAYFDARIREGYARNERVADIAAALGVTRNTIIGRARRMGLANQANRLAAMKRPEVRAARSASKAAYWAQPDAREATCAKMRAAWARRRAAQPVDA